jgi:hypothetical protein
MMEKLLLMLEYECHIQQVDIPWDDIVHRLQPGSSGPCATQMLNKMRDVLIVEGHMVPPERKQQYIPADVTVRGLIRADPEGNPCKVRMVRWDEKLEHRKESLSIEGIIRGSGKYTRAAANQTAGPREVPKLKLELPAEYKENRDRLAEIASKAKTAARRQRALEKRKAQRASQRSAVKVETDAEDEEEVADPAELDSDEDYNPTSTKKRRVRVATRISSVKANKSKVGAAKSSSSMMQFSTNDEEAPKETTLPIKLSVAPEILARFPAGQSPPPRSPTGPLSHQSPAYQPFTRDDKGQNADVVADQDQNNDTIVDDDATVSDGEQHEGEKYDHGDGGEFHGYEQADDEGQDQDQDQNQDQITEQDEHDQDYYERSVQGQGQVQDQVMDPNGHDQAYYGRSVQGQGQDQVMDEDGHAQEYHGPHVQRLDLGYPPGMGPGFNPFEDLFPPNEPLHSIPRPSTPPIQPFDVSTVLPRHFISD